MNRRPTPCTRPREVVLGFHGPGSLEQVPFYEPKGIYNIYACGSKAGKTFSVTEYMVKTAWEYPTAYSACWGSPYRNQLNQSFNLARAFLPPAYVEVNKQEKEIYFKHNGATLKWLPLDRDPEAIEGMGNNLVVLDEASKLKHKAWESALTTITQTEGIIIAISTPRGKDNWFFREYNRGLQDEPGYYAVNFPTFINPYVNLETVKRQKSSMPEHAYRQYILAEWLEGAGSKVFNSVDAAWTKPDDIEYGKVRPGERYIIGADLARLNDYSVLSTVRLDPFHSIIPLVDWSRFPHVNWESQKRMIKSKHEEWNNAPVIMDATGVGQPIAEDIAYKFGIPVEEYTMGGATNKKKRILVERLQMSFEQKIIKLPDLPEVRKVLEFELDQYEYTLTPSGETGFSAPPGVHDDSVISLALGNFAACNLQGGVTLRDLGLRSEDRSFRIGGTETKRRTGARRKSNTNALLDTEF